MTPKRQHSPTCPWKFKSAECGYTGVVVRNGTSDKLAEFTRSVGSLNYANVDDYLMDLTIGGTFTADTDDGTNHLAHAFDDDTATYWKSGWYRITGVTINDPGLGYSVNDVLTIIQGGASGGTATVTAVDGGDGHIDTISLTTGGNGYTVATGLMTTVVPNVGSGCLLNITTVDPMALPHWLCCQFAAAKTINQYTITPQTDGCAPSNFRLEGSSDGTTWVALDMQSNVGWPSTSFKRTFDVRLPGSYVYYRLWVLSNYHTADAPTEIKEFELIGSSTMVNDLDYNYTSNVATKNDMFGFEPIFLSSDAVISEVKVRVRAKQTDAAARDISGLIKIGGTVCDPSSGAIIPTLSYANYDFTWDTNAFSGAWTYQDFGVPSDQCDGVNSSDSLLHLDGENESNNIIDEYEKIWTAYGNAKLQIADKVWGTASLNVVDGASGHVFNTSITSLMSKFTIEGWFHLNNHIADHQAIIAAVNDAGFGLFLAYNRDSDEKMTLFLSSDGATWDIASTANKGAKVDWVNDTWYKFVIDYDGATYRVFFGTSGALTLDISTASASLICAITNIKLGKYLAYISFGGGFDELRVTIGRNQYGATATAEGAAFSTEPPIFADSYNTTYYPSNAIDDNINTYWLATTALPHWIGYYFHTAKIIKEFSITPKTTNRAPHDCIFQGSDDGVTWVNIIVIDLGVWTTGVVQYFGTFNTTAYHYYRLYITTNNGGTANYIEITELGMYETCHIEQFGYFTLADAGGHRVDVSECYLQITSDVTWCDYTHDRCMLLNNLPNYGGFKYMPELAIKEFWWGSTQKVWTGGE